MERIGQYVKGWWQWVNAGVDVIVQRAEELWKQKWDELHGGIKRYMTRSISGVNSKAETARAITEVYAPVPKPARREFVNLTRNVPLFTPSPSLPVPLFTPVPLFIPRRAGIY